MFGHITDYYSLPEARNAVVSMQAGQEVPSGWLGFYNERGENVSAIESHSEYRKVMHCDWEWHCQTMPARPPRWPEPWELCGYTWLCAWYWERVTIPHTFAYSSRHQEMFIVARYSASSQALGSFDILELRMLGAPPSWFAVTKHWGFATRIGDNRFKIF